MSIGNLFNEFIQSYNSKAMDAIWLKQSKKFQSFWLDKIIAKTASKLTDDQIDEIVMILDRSGKGNTKNTEALARVMVPQGAWRKLFYEFRSNKELSQIVLNIFTKKSDTEKAKAIDKLYKINEGKSNYLSGKSGNTVNALIAGWAPLKNLTIVSLNDRYMIIGYFKIKIPANLKTDTPGNQIIETNKAILDYFRKLGIKHSSRTISCFLYSPAVVKLWKKEYEIAWGNGQVNVVVPEGTPADDSSQSSNKNTELRASLKIQAQIAEIGAKMGFKIWIPKSDRGRVLTNWEAQPDQLLEHLPLGFDEMVLKTIENIDVIWISGRSIVRAFEVEHTTSIYSGLLRMADLIALIPNIDVKLHIVAPTTRKDKVFEEIKRPVFALLSGGSLSKYCTYLSYESISEMASNKHLQHFTNNVLDDFKEAAE